MQSTAEFYAGILIGVVFLTMGALMTVSPGSLQRRAQKNVGNWPLGNFLWIRDYANSPRYISITRLLGVLSVVAGVFLLIGVIAERMRQ